jgi:hypothetical protein
MRKSAIDDQNRRLVERQSQFRAAADIVAEAWAGFDEVVAIAVIGSVAKSLWKEIPRFREFRHAGIEVWHECADLDLALWIDRLDRLGELRRTTALSLRRAYEAGRGPSVVAEQLDIFLFEPDTDRYIGRLCSYGHCPKGKPACRGPGCGVPAFNKFVAGFTPYADILRGAADAMLYRRDEGRLRRACDLPPPPS